MQRLQRTPNTCAYTPILSRHDGCMRALMCCAFSRYGLACECVCVCAGKCRNMFVTLCVKYIYVYICIYMWKHVFGIYIRTALVYNTQHVTNQTLTRTQSLAHTACSPFCGVDVRISIARVPKPPTHPHRTHSIHSYTSAHLHKWDTNWWNLARILRPSMRLVCTALREHSTAQHRSTTHEEHTYV